MYWCVFHKVVRINSHDLALFQPVTSLVSSLNFVKSEHILTIQALEINKLTSFHSNLIECCSPLEAGLCVSLDKLFATSSGKSMYSNKTYSCCSMLVEAPVASEGLQQVFQAQSFHPSSLHLPAGSCLSSEFYAKLHQ